MLVKGKVSAIYAENGMVSVILPEYDNTVTFPLLVYGGNKKIEEYEVNEIVIVAVFNNDFNDAVVLGK